MTAARVGHPLHHVVAMLSHIHLNSPGHTQAPGPLGGVVNKRERALKFFEMFGGEPTTPDQVGLEIHSRNTEGGGRWNATENLLALWRRRVGSLGSVGRRAGLMFGIARVARPATAAVGTRG